MLRPFSVHFCRMKLLRKIKNRKSNFVKNESMSSKNLDLKQFNTFGHSLPLLLDENTGKELVKSARKVSFKVFDSSSKNDFVRSLIVFGELIFLESYFSFLKREDDVFKIDGKRRFHGAFTGGFSAGHWNTVGTEEGWTPQEFRSSRGEKVANKVKFKFYNDSVKKFDIQIRQNVLSVKDRKILWTMKILASSVSLGRKLSQKIILPSANSDSRTKESETQITSVLLLDSVWKRSLEWLRAGKIF